MMKMTKLRLKSAQLQEWQTLHTLAAQVQEFAYANMHEIVAGDVTRLLALSAELESIANEAEEKARRPSRLS